MISRPALLFLLATIAPLLGQTLSGRLPDSVRTTPTPVALAVFPVWTPPEALKISAAPDSLLLKLPVLEPLAHPGLKAQRWLGLGMVVLCSSLSYYYHQQAETTYQAYQSSGDPAELDALFRQTERLDRLTGWCYLGAETGLILVAFSYILSP
jgi:hypothetical protein